MTNKIVTVLRAVQIAQKFENRHLPAEVHAGGWLVENEHVGMRGKRSRQQHALLLAAGQVAEEPRRECLGPDPLERGARVACVPPGLPMG